MEREKASARIIKTIELNSLHPKWSGTSVSQKQSNPHNFQHTSLAKILCTRSLKSGLMKEFSQKSSLLCTV